MKAFRAFAALFALATPGAAAAADWELSAGACPARSGVAAVELVFGGVRASGGDLVVTVYGDRAEDFLAKGKKLAKRAVAAEAGTFAACLTLPAPGVYAITTFHDADRSGRLSRGFLGLPVEGYGFPNDPPVVFGPPGFDKVARDYPPGVTAVPIAMHYP